MLLLRAIFYDFMQSIFFLNIVGCSIRTKKLHNGFFTTFFYLFILSFYAHENIQKTALCRISNFNVCTNTILPSLCWLLLWSRSTNTKPVLVQMRKMGNQVCTYISSFLIILKKIACHSCIHTTITVAWEIQ